MPPAFHAMAVSILTGLFFFTLLAAIVRAVLTWRGADSKGRLAVAADLSSLWSATIGWVIVFGAIVTGFTIWSPSAVTNSPVMRNKILAAVLLLVTWGVFLAMRSTVRGNETTSSRHIRKMMSSRYHLLF